MNDRNILSSLCTIFNTLFVILKFKYIPVQSHNKQQLKKEDDYWNN